MKFTGKMWLMIILKATKMQESTLFLKNIFLEKLQVGSNWPFSLFRVKFVCQPNSWSDEKILKVLAIDEWGNHVLNYVTPGSTGKILFTEIHRAQQTSSVKQL